MKIHSIAVEDIAVPEGRQRKNISPESLLELAGSIAQVGLIHPIVVRRDEDNQIVLVAGERRLRALDYVWHFGQEVTCGEWVFEPQQVPCLFLGEIDPVAAFEIEYEENVRRTDLSWQDHALATARLAELKQQLAAGNGTEPPTTQQLAEDTGSPPERITQDLILARHLNDPEIAKARTRPDALRILDRKQKLETAAALGRRIGDELRSQHRLIRGDCLQILPTLAAESFDVILTDPPYGIDAQAFGDSGGIGGAAGGHFYDDSPEAWRALMRGFLPESFRVAKAAAHLYIFADIEHFLELRALAAEVGWKVFRTPLIWVNPSAMRAPWPDSGPQRKHQMVLYAKKGDRLCTTLCPDVFTFPAESNPGHPAAKPTAVYSELLRRSVQPGNNVLDPFCGSGPVFAAAHVAKCAATGIELDEAACGMSAKRLGELK